MYSLNTNVNCAVRNGKGNDVTIYKNTRDRTEFTEKIPKLKNFARDLQSI